MRRLAGVVCALGLLVACSDAGGGAEAEGLTVFAAASLTEAFTAIEAGVEADQDGVRVTYSFGGSQALVQQVLDGAPADVVATADQTTMDRLVRAGLVERPVAFARNTLVIAVEPGNPKDVRGLRDLARPDVVVVLADPSVPAGRYSADVLRTEGVSVQPSSLELDVKAALAKVTNGEADAAVVYTTDVRAARAKVQGIPIPNAEAVYPVATVRASTHRDAAHAFIAYLVEGKGRVVLRAAGFREA